VRVYVATANAGKLREMEKLFAGTDIELATFPGYVSPEEGETSYADNAAIKARALHAQIIASGQTGAVLADDSGLEVYALGGRPGVMSAYYGGTEATWPQRRAMLLAELTALAGHDRRARFVSIVHFIDANGREFAAMGTVDGEIALAERGDAGFSFDPVFLYTPAGRTFAELTEEEKNRVSHRAIAVAGLMGARLAAARMI
jgi:XTP/dITP diphosphohydrolase